MKVPRHSGPNAKPFIERFFSHIDDQFRRLPTGNGPKGHRSMNPERAAPKYDAGPQTIDELLAVTIANFNATPRGALGGRTPEEYLEDLADLCAHDESGPGEADQVQVEPPPAMRRLVVVRGNLAMGRRPHINFLGVKYTSDVLRNAFSLIGRKITIEVGLDLRTVSARSESGADLGPLMAAPPWHLIPHSVDERKAVLALHKEMKRDRFKGGDPVLAYMDYLEEGDRAGKPVSPSYMEMRRQLILSSEPRTSADQKNSPGASPEEPDRKIDKST